MEICAKTKNSPAYFLIQYYFIYWLLSSENLFWNSILFRLLLDDRAEVYVPETFLGSKVKPHYYYYLLKLNCRTSMIPSAHIFLNL